MLSSLIHKAHPTEECRSEFGLNKRTLDMGVRHQVSTIVVPPNENKDYAISFHVQLKNRMLVSKNCNGSRRASNTSFYMEWCTGQEERPSLLLRANLAECFQIPHLSNWRPPLNQ